MRTLNAEVQYPRGFCSNIRRASVSYIPLFGTYTVGGNATEITPWGPFYLTSTGATHSSVELKPTILANRGMPFTFGELVSLYATFHSTSGGASDGSPRLIISLLDDMSVQRKLAIYLGRPPDYLDNDPVLNTFSGFNVIGNNDSGRYDTSEFSGGSAYTDYWHALSIAGKLEVKKIGFVIEGDGEHGARQEILFKIGGGVRRRAVYGNALTLINSRNSSLELS